MEMILKNHRALITLLGLWTSPWFLASAHGLQKKHSKSFIKALKKTKECSLEEKELGLSQPSMEISLIEGTYLVKTIFIPSVDFFPVEKYSKKQTGLSPPFLA